MSRTNENFKSETFVANRCISDWCVCECELQTHFQSRRPQSGVKACQTKAATEHATCVLPKHLDWRLASVYEPSVLAWAILRLSQCKRCLGRQSQWRDRQSLCCRMASVHNLDRGRESSYYVWAVKQEGIEISEAIAASTLTETVTWAAHWKLATRCCAPVERWEESWVENDAVRVKKKYLIYTAYQSYSSVLRQKIVGASSEDEHFPFGPKTRCVPQPETQRTIARLIRLRSHRQHSAIRGSSETYLGLCVWLCL